MNNQKRLFLVSFCNNKKKINYVNGTGILGICEVSHNSIEYRELPLELEGLESINGATGISKCDEFYYIVLQSKTSKLLILDYSFKVVSVQTLFDFKGVHSICYSKGYLYIVVTKQDKVIKYDLKGSYETLFDNRTNKDSLHLNSICLHENNLFISGFGVNNKKHWIHANNGFVMNLITGKKIIEGLKQPHSLFSFDNELYVCDSSKKRIVNCKGKPLIKNNKGYTRGLYINEKVIVYGVSKGRTVSVTNGDYVGNISDKGILSGECSINVKTKDLNTFCFKDISDEIYDIFSLS
jgi:hypothetical protein